MKKFIHVCNEIYIANDMNNNNNNNSIGSHQREAHVPSRRT